ncbi:hypothetical protein JTE90_027088 [Oedothorax gibbosus]|uniref:Uncharacterized protein n=1 Tax=Oedothorax gibbosus TaxID=931172 RepID=A0AAV6U7D4_9ARAC|nr:hypothetical protein JTE90_027088 [Oedothorax gibbosus]
MNFSPVSNLSIANNSNIQLSKSITTLILFITTIFQYLNLLLIQLPIIHAKSFILIFTALYLPTSSSSPCGGHFTQLQGVLHTPHFPFPFEAPLFCEWVIEAPPGGRVAVYFTQFYLKTGLSAADYSYYATRLHAGMDRHDFGSVDASKEPTYLVSNQRVLVLRLRVSRLNNIHLRVREHLLDAAGFNVTYEVVGSSSGVRNDACIYHHCSFTGMCFATSDFTSYACSCFGGYFGDECQHDDSCGPTATDNVCRNGGTCRYYIGSSVRTCECLPGYSGAKCENVMPLKQPKSLSSISDLECDYPPTQGYITIYPEDFQCQGSKKLHACFSTDSSLILRVELSEPMPVAEGAPLMLACVARGHPVVRWLRDGVEIALEATRGRLWSMRVPGDTNGWHTHLLGFDVTRELDSGTFTCSATTDDDSTGDSLSADVSVRPKSPLLVDPMSLSVSTGGDFKVTCVAEDGDRAQDRKYEWTRDGRELVWAARRMGEDAVVEDLYPMGSRLLVSRAVMSANYSCRMRTDASVTVCATVEVTVLRPSEFLSKTCPPEKSSGVRWKVTAVGSVDAHKCPPGYTGYIRRRCIESDTKEIRWDEPDFSTCFSPTMLALRKEYASRLLGYRRRPLNQFLMGLLEFLSWNHEEMHQSEAEPAVAMLLGAGPDLEPMQESYDNWNLTLSIVSILMQSDIVKKHQERVNLHSFVRDLSLKYGEAKEAQWPSQFRSTCLSVNIFKLLLGNISQSVRLPLCYENLRFCLEATITVDRKDWSQNKSQDNTSVTILAIFYKCFSYSGFPNVLQRNENSSFTVLSVDVSPSRLENSTNSVHTTISIPATEVGLYSKLVCLKMKFQPNSNHMHATPCPSIQDQRKTSKCLCGGTGFMYFHLAEDRLSKSEGFNFYPVIVVFISGGIAVVVLALGVVVQMLWDIRTKIHLHL